MPFMSFIPSIDFIILGCACIEVIIILHIAESASHIAIVLSIIILHIAGSVLHCSIMLFIMVVVVLDDVRNIERGTVCV